MANQLIHVLEPGGDDGAAELPVQLEGKAEAARELVNRLCTIRRRKTRTAEALSDSGLVRTWPGIVRGHPRGRWRFN